MIAAGVGFRESCSAEEILSLVREVMERGGTASIACLASAHFKNGAACLHEAAAALGVPVALICEQDLAAAGPRCVTQAISGRPSIAEAACLAAAGPTSRLLLRRLATARATCALATS
jgi:cobalt-precorrin 5A hydrolase